MSNRIDFYQSQQASLAQPAACVSVQLDGRPCPCLEVKEVVRGGRYEFGWAKLQYNAAAYPDGQLKDTEQIAAQLETGREIRIGRFYNEQFPAARALTIPIFVGKIAKVEMTIDEDGERIEVTARDFSADMEQITIDQDSADFSEMTYAKAIHYLLSEYVGQGRLGIPLLSKLKALTSLEKCDGLDVTGLNLTQAINRLSQAAGIEFKFVPRLCETGPEQAICFYRLGFGPIVELNCQKKGQQINASNSNIARLTRVREAADDGRITEACEVQTLYLEFDYQLGDIVTSSPESRDLFGIRNDKRSVCWIERMQMDFDNQCTELEIRKQRI